MVGALGAALLVTFAPDPLHLVYEVLLGITVVMIVLLWWMPETVSRKSGALASLRPHVSVPEQSRAVLLRADAGDDRDLGARRLPLSLMPTVVATTMGVERAMGRRCRRCRP